MYASAWLKCHHPAAFAAALINSQPMGFYAPAQIVRDAKEHGVEVRPIDANRSVWDCTLERDARGGWALRLGMRLVKGLREAEAAAIAAAARTGGPFRTPDELWRRSGVRVQTLRALAAADAFGSMGLDRQTALWRIRSLKDEYLPLFDGLTLPAVAADTARLPPIAPLRNVIGDYTAVGLSLKAHPVAFIRERLAAEGAVLAADLRDDARCPADRTVHVAGIVLNRQRPGTAGGTTFMTIEDESGAANLIVRREVFDRYKRAARHGATILATGRVERKAEVVHVLVRRIRRLDPDLAELPARSRDYR